MNRYLNGNPIPWLLGAENPDVRYLTLKEFPGAGGPDVRLEAEYGKKYNTPFYQKMKAASHQGVMGDRDRFDIIQRGTMWYFAESVARGYDIREPLLEKTAHHILGSCQTSTGGFIMNWKPPVEVSCRTGDMIRCLVDAGLQDDRIDRGVQWICGHQRHDGGWLHCPVSGSADMLRLLLLGKAGTGLSREEDVRCQSCVPASAACLSALLAYRGIRTGEDDPFLDGCIHRGAGFFLSHHMFSRTDRRNVPVCLRLNSKTDYGRLGYPVMSRYDLLYGCMIIARAGLSSDGRFGEAFNAIVLKQNDDGSWNNENRGEGMLRDEEESFGKKSKWVTLNAMRMLSYAGVLDGTSVVERIPGGNNKAD